MKFFTSAVVIAALFSAETNAIKVQGSNDGLKAILGAIIAGGDGEKSSDSCGCNKCPCGAPEKKHSGHHAADAARKVIEKATEDLERKAEERENQKKTEAGIKKVEQKAEKAKEEQEQADEAKEIKHAVKKAEHK
jgi:hypothetical protein|tara:strand:+ start:89 stop:493 length:405 start_codon:yes stop_codon:yes gene_type:complete